MSDGWIDVSLPLSRDLLTWPGNAPLRVSAVRRIAAGDDANVSELHLGTHAGTHVDPPRHFLDGAAGVDRLPLDALIGPCWVADARGTGGALRADDLDALDVPAGTERLLLRTDNSVMWREEAPAFPDTYVSIAADGARWVREHGIRLVGIDFLGIEARGARGHPTHVELLSHEVVIVEGLDLDDVGAGAYDLVVLPLRLVDGDGAPARAVIRPR